MRRPVDRRSRPRPPALPYAILLGLGALDAAGYSVIAPVVPALAERTGAGPTAMGALVGLFAVGMAAGFVLGGIGVRRAGARAVLVGAGGVLALATVAFLLADGYAAYAAARTAQGVGSGGLWIGVVFGVLERFPGAEYRRLTGVLAAYSVGAVAGPALGALEGVRAPFAAYLALVAAGTTAAWLLGPGHPGSRFGGARARLLSPTFVAASAGVLLVSLVFGVLDGPLALSLGRRLSQSELGLLYVGTALALAAASIAAGRMRPARALGAGAVLATGAVAAAGLSEEPVAWIAELGLTGVGLGLAEAGALGLLVTTTRTDAMVAAMVAWSQMWAVGYFAGPLGAGALAETVGFGALGLVPAGALVLLGAAALLSRGAGRRTAAEAAAPDATRVAPRR